MAAFLVAIKLIDELEITEPDGSVSTFTKEKVERMKKVDWRIIKLLLVYRVYGLVLLSVLYNGFQSLQSRYYVISYCIRAAAIIGNDYRIFRGE